MRRSAVVLVVFAVLAHVGQVDAEPQQFLRISEMMYDPYPPNPSGPEAGYSPTDFEFVEMLNVSNKTIDLTGVQFVRGIQFDFTGSSVTTLDPDAMVLVGKSWSALELRYGSGLLDVFAGEYALNLSNTGERITLVDRLGDPIADFTYDDYGDWPGRADGKGSSLELIDPWDVPQTEPARTDYLENGSNWRASSEYGGSPGFRGTGPIPGVVVNEVLSYPAEGGKDWIELYNRGPSDLDISGWYLSDSWGWAWDPGSGDYKKFRIPDGTNILADGYVVFDEDHFNPGGGTLPTDFALDGIHGDDVWLMEADAATGELTRFADHVQFGPAAVGESLGRWPNGQGDLCPMARPTPGEPNSGPIPEPSSLMLLGIGAVGLVVYVWRKRRRR